MRRLGSVRVARSAGAERGLAGLLGLILVLGGTAVLLLGNGVFGDGRSRRSIMDPIAVERLENHRELSFSIAITAGVVLLVVGLWWCLRGLRPEHKPALLLDPMPEAELVVTPDALSGAVQADAESVRGVSRARARVVGSTDEPGLRLHLWLRQGADIRTVWNDLDTQVLARARESLGIDRLPTAVRIELDTAEAQRVV